MAQKYCIVQRPGHFGQNQAIIFSSHRTLTAARKAKGKSGSVCIVLVNKEKGDVVWGDMFPQIVE